MACQIQKMQVMAARRRSRRRYRGSRRSRPRPVSNATFTHALGHALHRPAVLAVPQAILRLVVGAEMTSEFLLASQRAVPKRLLKDGFIFADDELADALRTALGDSARVPPGG